MIGIKAIASAIPEASIDNTKQAVALGSDPAFASEKLGVSQLPVMDEGWDTSDLAAEAVRNMFTTSDLEPESVDVLVVCTQNPDASGIPHTSAIVQAKVGLSKTVAAFDISLGCSGYVYGLHVLKGFLESTGLKNGLLVTADPYSKIVDRSDRNTTMLFGDAATATLLTADDPVFHVGPVMFATDGELGDAIANVDGTLHMQGRQVFNFAASRVPQQIRELLETANVAIEEVDLFLLHQGSRHIVMTLAKRLKLEAGRVPVEIQDTGNTVSSSLPLLLESRLEDASIGQAVLSGFGVGLSWASTLISRTG